MPARVFVDDDTDWMYPLPDPFLLAPPAQTSSGRLLHHLEYDVVQAYFDGPRSSDILPRAQSYHTPNVHVHEGSSAEYAAIPAAFEGDEEIEFGLLHHVPSVIEVYVQGGLLCERPAMKLSVPSDIMRVRRANHGYDDTDSDSDDDWEVITPGLGSLASFHALDDGKVEAAGVSASPQINLLSGERKGPSNKEGRYYRKAPNLVTGAAMMFMARWRA